MKIQRDLASGLSLDALLLGAIFGPAHSHIVIAWIKVEDQSVRISHRNRATVRSHAANRRALQGHLVQLLFDLCKRFIRDFHSSLIVGVGLLCEGCERGRPRQLPGALSVRETF